MTMETRTNKELIKAFINWVKVTLFAVKTKQVLDDLEQEVQTQVKEEIKEHFEPLFSEEAPKKPGSPAALLGGALRLTAKWKKKHK